MTYLFIRLEDNHYLLVVNASNIDKDYKWIEDHLDGDVSIDNLSEKMAQLALQGPVAEKVLQKLTGDNDLSEIGFFKFQQEVNINGKNALVSRTGYTGEDGFEIYCDAKDAVETLEGNFSSRRRGRRCSMWIRCT